MPAESRAAAQDHGTDTAEREPVRNEDGGYAIMHGLKFEVAQTNGIIKVNFEELEKGLREKLSEYEGAVFTEE